MKVAIAWSLGWMDAMYYIAVYVINRGRQNCPTHRCSLGVTILGAGAVICIVDRVEKRIKRLRSASVV